MIAPTPTDIGRGVVYRAIEWTDAPVEYGVISSFNDAFVFVHFGPGMTAQACNRADLEWEIEG